MTLLSAPLHPLFVHGAVVFIPLAALAAAVFVLKPEWRYLTRWPTAIINVLALGALFITRWTGENLMEQLLKESPAKKELVEAHDTMAGLLTVSTIPMVALALFAAWSFAGSSGLASGAGAREARFPKFAPATTWLVVLGALATIVFTVLAGHTGATAAWTK